MIPRRRYRLFTICAVFMVFMLYRVAHNLWNEPDGYSKLPNRPVPPPLQHSQPDVVEKPPPRPEAPEPEDDTKKTKLDPVVEDTKSEKTKEKTSKEDAKEETIKIPTLKEHDGKKGGPGSGEDSKDTKLDTERPTRTKQPSKNVIDQDEKLQVDVHWKNPPKDVKGLQKEHDTSDEKHWEKPKENFPLPKGSMLVLPIDKPKKIPKIQYDFGTELDEVKEIRLKRQKRVKAELERAWTGYRKHAWMHDELSPVSAKYRDPFCGWAATLVDSLDTLWIAGLKDEFDEAAKAVANIDFTYSTRNDIPVFETTIRYLGGLLAAFDVSGGHDGDYPILLEKATELAEILMGIFDTPNRMPILYYRWRPPYSSQPHRASNVGIAELATLSLEFTRLAQLTHTNKYFDAVERITDALIDMQKAGTKIPGLFPEKIDASGCNKTATTLQESLSHDAQKQMVDDEYNGEPAGYRSGDFNDKKKADERLERRAAVPPTRTAPEDDDLEKVERPSMLNIKLGKPPLAADGSTSEWDCVPQGLVAGGYGYQTFHMGGGQDSAYEYFQKQYLLLGGLEPKYQKLHEDTIDAVNEWLMFRPMIKDEGWDILFPAKVTTSGDPETDLSATFEVAHLTCFIGGMFGMGGKIFNREKDIETAKKLTDGCVWAYQSTASGIMPEYAHIMPCPTLDKCEFNETKWWEELDPSKEWRAEQVEAWEKEQAAKAKQEKLKSDNKLIKKTTSEDEDDSKSKSSQLRKRDSSSVTSRETIEDDEAGSELPDSLKEKLNIGTKESKTEKKDEAEEEEMPKLQRHAVEDSSDGDEDEASPATVPSRPYGASYSWDKPLTHEEYIKSRLESENIPPGYSSIVSPNYILRPEAIESVWYMYRITGDPTWMDKGWKMFEATITATRTELANSAIDDVLSPSPRLKDEMESFWIAETLKYYYLLFSEPDVISLDEWVLNTEAHPFKRPT